MFDIAMEDEVNRGLAERLFTQYRYLLFSRANAILHDAQLAEGAVQETFVRVLANLHKINEENCPQTRNYLVIICENVSKRMYSKRKKEVLMEEDFKPEAAESDPMRIAVSRDNLRLVVDAIKALPPIYRDVLLLKHVHGHSRAEICELLSITPEALKKRFIRARQKLEKVLRKEGLR